MHIIGRKDQPETSGAVRVGDMKIGGEKLKDALRDDPKVLAMIQDDAIDNR